MIPQHTKKALINWVKIGNQYDHGSFLTAIVSNDLMKSFSCADDLNLYSMLDIVKWMYNNLPISCYGSIKKMKEWKGLEEEEFNRWLENINKK